MPGKYTVVLTAGGKSYSQPLTLQMDPRLKASVGDLAEQFKLSRELYDEWLGLASTSESIRLIRGQLTDLRPRASAEDLKKRIDDLGQALQALAGGGGPPGAPGAGAAPRPTIATVTGRVRTLFSLIQDVDLAPTPQAGAAVSVVREESRVVQESWQAIKTRDIVALNQELRAAGLPVIEMQMK
jgi:hypothetical protein